MMMQNDQERMAEGKKETLWAEEDIFMLQRKIEDQGLSDSARFTFTYQKTEVYDLLQPPGVFDHHHNASCQLSFPELLKQI